MKKKFKLLPCPFCGGEAKYFIHTINFGKDWGSREVFVKIGCINHDCLVKPFMGAINEDKEKTAEIWNRRTNHEK